MLMVAAMVSVAQATVLTFDTGQGNNADLSLTFGSNLSTNMAGGSISNGATPTIGLAWAPSPNVWEIHSATSFQVVFGTGQTVVQLDVNGGEADPTITFSVDDGAKLQLNSLVIGHANDQTGEAFDWTITLSEDGGPQVFSHTTAALFRGKETVTFDFTGEAGVDYVLKFDDGGQDTAYAAIDDLSFSQILPPIAARVDVEARTGAPTSVTILNQTTDADLWVSDDNRGDFGLGYPGISRPILQANGVVIANCNELPTSGAKGSVAVTGALSSGIGGNGDNGGMWIVSFTADGNGGEANYDFSFGWFPYALGWIGGHINAAGTGFDGSGNLPAGSTVSVATSPDHAGEHLLTLNGINPRTDGMLFVIDARNNDNIAAAGVPDLDTIEGSNSWHIAAFDESGNFDTYEQGRVSFLYVPYSTEGLCGGWIDEDGTEKESRGQFSVTRTGTGEYELVIPDDANGRYDDSDGVLLLTVAKLIEDGDSGSKGVDDNAIAWAYDAAADGGDGAFVVETYDLANWTDQDTEFVFAFVRYDGLFDVPGPPQGTIIAIQ